MAAVFVEAGVGKGTRVGLIMPNGVRWVQVAIALTRIGAVLVPLSTLLAAGELVAQLRTASVQFLVSVEEFRGHRYLDDLQSALSSRAFGDETLQCPELPALRQVWTDDRLAGAAAGERARRIVDAMTETVTAADPLVIMFTSGSSGPPKGVMHSHGSALGAVQAGLAARCITSDTRLYLPMPFFWVGGFGSGILSALLAGATLVTEEIPRPETTLRLLERERVTLFRGWPDQAEALARHADTVGADLSALQPGSLEALLPPEQRARPGARATLFGMTEAFGPYCGYPADTDMPATAWGSCGKPFPGMEVRIVDPDSGEPVAGGNRWHDPDPRTAHAARTFAVAAAKSCSPPTVSTPPATSATSTRTGSCSTTADPTTCSKSVARPSTPAKSSGRCAPSTASITPSSPMCPALQGERVGAAVVCGDRALTAEQLRGSRAQAAERLQSADGMAVAGFRRRRSARRHRQGRHPSAAGDVDRSEPALWDPRPGLTVLRLEGLNR